jgi:hypothetical protein
MFFCVILLILVFLGDPGSLDEGPGLMASVEISEKHLESLRAEVREIVRPDCGSCHTSGRATAKPKALEVFDLSRGDWSAEMNHEEIDSFRRRTRDLTGLQLAKADSLAAAESMKFEGPKQ